VKSKKDLLDLSAKMLESMMKEAMKSGSSIPYEDKLKLLDRVAKIETARIRQKSGGMGSGFDEPGETDDAGEF
jgi:signal transduction histidine kinase